MSRVRPPAVAGSFYPGRPSDLTGAIRQYLEAVLPHETEEIAPENRLKAIIVPHAGYIYSGPVAASAYAILQPLAGEVSRVILLGPAHTVYLRGIAAPRAEVFEVPLGPLAVDLAAIAAIADLPEVVLDDVPHAHEHCLEVQLPFLKMILGHVSIVPLVVGNVEPATVARVVERLWGGPESLIILSTDLSHYLAYGEAQSRDAMTAAAIEALDGSQLTPEDACGAHALTGFLAAARARRMAIERLDLRNSGDTAGSRDRVVGYGAWILREIAG